MNLSMHRPFQWAVENGAIRFSSPPSGTLEIVSRLDYDPRFTPGMDETIFDGSTELGKLFYVVLQDFVTMKIAERLWSMEDNAVKKASKFQNLQYWTGKYEKSLLKAKSVHRQREQRVIRLQPIIKSQRRSRDYRGY